MSEFGAVTSISLATIFTIAAVGKALGPSTWSDAIVCIAELGLSAMLLLRPASAIVAGMTCLFSVGLTALSLRPAHEAPCRCFGVHLPATSPRGRRERSVAALVLSVALVLAAVTASTYRPPGLVGATLGIMVGLLIVAGPWLRDWLSIPAST
jgi:hypothetical protein